MHRACAGAAPIYRAVTDHGHDLRTSSLSEISRVPPMTSFRAPRFRLKEIKAHIPGIPERRVVLEPQSGTAERQARGAATCECPGGGQRAHDGALRTALGRNGGAAREGRTRSQKHGRVTCALCLICFCGTKTPLCVSSDHEAGKQTSNPPSSHHQPCRWALSFATAEMVFVHLTNDPRTPASGTSRHRASHAGLVRPKLNCQAVFNLELWPSFERTR